MAWPADHIGAIARQAQLERFHERTGGEFVCHEHITENPDSLPGNHRLQYCSSNPIWWLIAVGVTPSSAAAFLKLRWRAAASKARSSIRGGSLCMRPV